VSTSHLNASSGTHPDISRFCKIGIALKYQCEFNFLFSSAQN
jgi:hypothetical protein